VIAKLADGVDPATGDAAIDAAMEPFPQANVQSNAEFLDSQEAQINQLLLIIGLLLAFAIVIAILGISITLALGVFERTREIGLLRAVGMNRRQTRRSVRWEAVIVSTFGALVGIVVGTFLGVLLSITIVLLPFGRQCFKLAHFALWPFGRTAIPSPTAVAGGTIGNILWFIPGLFLAVGYAVSGVLLCVTIIGIPFGIQSFKFVPLALFPFGKEIVRDDDLRDDIGVARTSA